LRHFAATGISVAIGVDQGFADLLVAFASPDHLWPAH